MNALGTDVTKNIQNSNGGVIKKTKNRKKDYVQATVCLAEKQKFSMGRGKGGRGGGGLQFFRGRPRERTCRFTSNVAPPSLLIFRHYQNVIWATAN